MHHAEHGSGDPCHGNEGVVRSARRARRGVAVFTNGATRPVAGGGSSTEGRTLTHARGYAATGEGRAGAWRARGDAALAPRGTRLSGQRYGRTLSRNAAMGSGAARGSGSAAWRRGRRDHAVAAGGERARTAWQNDVQRAEQAQPLQPEGRARQGANPAPIASLRLRRRNRRRNRRRPGSRCR